MVKIVFRTFVALLLGGMPLQAKGEVQGTRQATVPLRAARTWDEMTKSETSKGPIGIEKKHIHPPRRGPGPKPVGNATRMSPSLEGGANGLTGSTLKTVPPSHIGTFTSPALSFDAILDNNTIIPPDTYGSVGSQNIMTMLNSQVRVQEKTGLTDSTLLLETFWADSLTGDPRVNFDVLSGRWIAVCASILDTIHSAIHLAVSATSNPLGTWNFYKFDAAAVADSESADFPTIGFNGRWIAICANMFKPDGNSSGCKMWVIDKSTALSGSPLAMTIFPTNFDLAGDLNGFSLLPCLYITPSDTLYLIDNSDVYNTSDTTFALRLSFLSGPTASPVWKAAPNSSFPSSGLFLVSNNFNASQIDATQSGTPIGLDSGDNRMLNALYRSGRIWCSHSGGLPAKIAPTPDRTAAFWYQINPSAMPSPIVQSGVIDGGVGVHHIYPSISANSSQDAVVGFTRSDATRFPEAAYTGRRSTDPAGTMQPVQVIQPGLSFYAKFFSGNSNRWGDFSNTCVDPTDDRTFWTIQEYAGTRVGSDNNSGRWATRWAKIDPVNIVQDVAPVTQSLPQQTTLDQNFPNPFNPSTTIKFSLSRTSRVTLRVLDMLGREVALLLDENLPAATYTVPWWPSGLASGVYVVRLQAGGHIQQNKALLLK